MRCRVLGTFYIGDASEVGGATSYRLFFGSDLSNYYPNRGLKVFKPRAEVLRAIVNYRDPRLELPDNTLFVNVGEVRYASTNRPFQNISGVKVAITPTDLLGQKTALFGMTRTANQILQRLFSSQFSNSGGVLRGNESVKLFSIRMVSTPMRTPRIKTRTKFPRLLRTCGLLHPSVASRSSSRISLLMELLRTPMIPTAT